MEYKQLFDSDTNIKYIEIGTYRKCYWDTPYNPDKFELIDGKIRCKQLVTTIEPIDLPLLHYYDRDMNEYSVTDISGLFTNSDVVSVNAYNWNTETVQNMSEMFYKCRRLKSFSCETWNVSSVTNMNGMFYKCKQLKSLNVSDWDVSNVITTSYMFAYCIELESLDCSKWDTSNIINLSNMFKCCIKLKHIGCSEWVYRANANNWSMLYHCKTMN